MNETPFTPETNGHRVNENAEPSPNGHHRFVDRLSEPSPNGGNGHPPEPAAETSGNGTNGRDARGRFTRGNAGGPGNPFARRVAGLRQAVCAAVTEQDIHTLVHQLLERAKGGDVAAVKLVFAYTIGQPAEAVNPDTLDLEEWHLYRQASTRADDVSALLTRMPLGMACELIRLVMPCLTRGMANQFLEKLEGGAVCPPPGPEQPLEGR